jgi:hypothetical protein
MHEMVVVAAISPKMLRFLEIPSLTLGTYHNMVEESFAT